MKPINAIVYVVASLLALAGLALILGSVTQDELFVSIATIAFLVAFLASCIPLLALGAVAAKIIGATATKKAGISRS
jgi:hypothetical protein